MARPNDLPALFELVDSYSEEFEHDKTVAKNSLREIVYMNSVLLVEFEGKYIGGIAGYMLPGLFNKELYFSTMFFYVIKEFRFLTKRIMKELELVLLPTEITKIVYSIPVGENFEKRKRFMRIMGYNELETHMIKDLNRA